MTHNPHLNYRPDIDGLRALAILLVIIFHAYPKFIRGGFIGVDIFFVISGYLITSIILKGLNQENFSLLEFYSRRIKRIFPALIVVLSFCLISGWFILLADEYQLLGKHIAAGSIYISNFILESESGYFDVAGELKPLLHLWSLSIEEQFYLVFPLILIATYKLNKNPFISISLSLLISFILNLIIIKQNEAGAFFYPHTRVWELLIGSSVAYINLYKRYEFDKLLNKICFRVHSPRENFSANMLAWLSLLLIIIAWIFFNNSKITYPNGWALLPTLGAAGLILAGENAWLNKRLLSNKVMVFIGLISYPLYLWHWPLLSFTRLVEMEHPSSMLRFNVLVLSVIFAWLTYYFIEKKLRSCDHWSITISLLSCLILIGALGYYVKKQKGYPQRFEYITHFFQKNKQDLRADDGWLPKYWMDKWITEESCTNRFGKHPFCLIEDGNLPVTKILIGDSHANHLYPGLLRYSKMSESNLLNLGVANCLPFFRTNQTIINKKNEMCGLFMDKALNIAISTPSIQVVIINAYWSKYLKEKKILDNNYAITFQSLMRNTLQRLIEYEKKVVFVMDIPILNFRLSSCIERPWRITGNLLVKTPCGITRLKVENNAQEYSKLVTQVLMEFPQVEVWNPMDAFCDKTYCWAVKEGEMLYRDENHLSESGSIYLWKYLNSKYLSKSLSKYIY